MIELKPYASNAKKHPRTQLEALARIVAEVGWRQPILVNQEKVIIAGHGRYLTWQEYGAELGLDEPWVIDDKGKTLNGGPATKQMTPEQEAAYRLADNKLNESEWDMKLVIPELKGLSLPMLELTGFSADLILEDDDADDQTPEAPEKPQSEAGDLYQLGEHYLLVGDSTKEEDVMRLFGNMKADMVFTDPPYNIAYEGSGKNTSNGIENDDMSEMAFDDFLGKVFENYGKIVKKGAGLYIFHDARTAWQFEKALQDKGFDIKSHLIWNKPSAGLGMGDYRRKHEPFFYAAVKDEKPQFYGNRTNATVIDLQASEEDLLKWVKKQKRLESQGKTTVWSVKREPTGEYVHPTQKPVELVTYALANSSKAGDIVADLFLGSGTTLIGCEKAGRACYGMEMDPRYADVIVERYCQYTGNREIIKNGKTLIWLTNA